MRRREFFSLLGGIAAAIPSGVRAQQAPLIGYLATIPLSQHEGLIAAFRRGMEQAGFVDGRNVRIEYRTADGRTERLPMLAAELVGHKVNLLAGMARHYRSLGCQGRGIEHSGHLYCGRC